MLEKIYALPLRKGLTTRYSPAQCCGAKPHKIMGKPVDDHISTCYAERMHLQIRMGMGPFTTLTNAHSKKGDNNRHALVLHSMHYNFARIHQALRVTPAMEVGTSNHVSSLEEIRRNRQPYLVENNYVLRI